MSCQSPAEVKDSTSEVVMNAPVEIWKEIIDQILFDPILFSSDPFYPGCNYHTALNEWSDTKRLLKLEVQRGILRLVSRSWKVLAELSPWQYFEPYRCVDQKKVLQASKACRVEYFHLCHECGHVMGSRLDECNGCSNYINGAELRKEFHHLDNYPFNAEILRLPHWRETRSFLSESKENLTEVFPHLYALFISVDPLFIEDFGLLSKLTFLSLQTDPEPDLLTYQNPKKVPHSIRLPIKTLQLRVSGTTCLNLFGKWDLPFLAHLELTVTSYFVPSMETLFADIGRNLVTLHLHYDQQCIAFLDDIWGILPNLEYIGTTELEKYAPEDPFPPSPPPGHPLRTFAILEPDKTTLDSRWYASRVVLHWKTIKTIADSHSWADVPQDFADPKTKSIAYSHIHMPVSCRDCVLALYWVCITSGVRYEDRSGKTWSEFQSLNRY